MTPSDIEGERNTHILRKLATYCKSAASNPEAKERVEANLSLPRLPLSLDTSSLSVSPTRIIRPKAKSSLASWVRLTSNEDPDQDLPPTRKLSLGRHFQDDMDDEDFVLIAPQPVIAKPCVTQHLVTREVHRRQEVPQSVTSSTTQVFVDDSHQFHLSRRDIPLRNPFSVIQDNIPNERHQHDEPNVIPDTVTSTPPTTNSFHYSLSPPPCRHESPMDGMNVPERLLLPSL